MDAHSLALLIPIMALGLVLAGMQKFARFRLEETRLRMEGLDGSSREELNALRGEVDDLRRELGEAHERLDLPSGCWPGRRSATAPAIPFPRSRADRG